MRILKIKRDKTLSKTSVYDLMNEQQIECLNTNKVEEVVKYLKKEVKPIDYLLIPLNRPYRDACYGIGRTVKLVITEDEIRQFLECIFGQSFVAYMEEAAVSVMEASHMGNDLTAFFIYFYQAKTREEAEKIYNSWQEFIPTDDVLFYKILRTLESYRIEILNYFEVKPYLKAGMPM